ncbi:protein LHCP TRANSLOCATION DEFECT-like [Vigna unguiculata]|uniref:protein LHCP TRANSLOCATION DEFECT-like n=1 Tax=Vigna unguiculata TaxID=3917 RepID=UPI001015F5BF|nr:protein LHCP TRANSLOCATION DEFECT-like [Vigna unguiculata]
MASISCITHHPVTSKLKNFFPSPHVSASDLASRFLGTKKSVGWLSLTSRIGPSNGSRATCWFRFGKNGVDAEGAGIYGSQSRDDFDRDDVEQVELYRDEDCVESTREDGRVESYRAMVDVSGARPKVEKRQPGSCRAELVQAKVNRVNMSCI